MRMLNRYVQKFYAERKEFQPLASTFLYQRRWESELETMRKRLDVQNIYAKQLMEKWSIKSIENENTNKEQ